LTGGVSFPESKNRHHPRYWWLMPVIPATQEAEIKRIQVPSQPEQIVCETLPQKYPTQNRAVQVARVVELLPSKCEILSSNSSASKKKNRNHKVCDAYSILEEPQAQILGGGGGVCFVR
jgi:hypothetical protein